jgi:lysosomal Pro-X carboxypeptidase
MRGSVLSVFVAALGTAASASYHWDTAYFTQDLDHFNFENSTTFEEKYLTNADSWHAGGPIFFYTGNEGPIELFAANTGFMWELAEVQLPFACISAECCLRLCLFCVEHFL